MTQGGYDSVAVAENPSFENRQDKVEIPV